MRELLARVTTVTSRIAEPGPTDPWAGFYRGVLTCTIRSGGNVSREHFGFLVVILYVAVWLIWQKVVTVRPWTHSS